MRVLVVTSDYPPALGGMAEYSEAWARGFSAAGAAVTVLARSGGQAEGRKPAIKAKLLSWRDGPIRSPWAAARALSRACGEVRPNIVMAHTWIGWGPALAWLKGRTGIRYVLSAHGAEVLGPAQSIWYRFLMTQAFRGADRIFAVSGFTADVVASLGVARERIAVIGNGVDLDRYQPAPRNEELMRRYGLADHEIIVTVGALVERKGQDIVLEAVARLKERRPRLRYVIAGGWALNSSSEERLRAQAARLGIEDRVIFTGFVADRELPDHYRLGDLFVMTGREVKEKGWVEGFGISYLEAAACGVPIIATPTGGVCDAVTDENALMVPAEDATATADAISKLMDDPARRAKMSVAGRDWAEKNAWSLKVKAGLEIMERILTHV
jgi:phosphatidylinositol alpha-1,6-mannosyltransferase